MSEYGQKLKHPLWQRKRLEIMQRDGFKCRECGKDDETLHVHHVAYSRGEPWDTPDHLLICLCHECHDERHSAEAECKDFLNTLMASLTVKGIYALSDLIAEIGTRRRRERRITFLDEDRGATK